MQMFSRSGDDPSQPWYITTGARAVGSLAGIISMIMGFLNLITLSVGVGVVLMIEGFILTLIEAPCLCMFLEFAQIPSKAVEGRPPWMRATIYLGFGIIPFCIGFSVGTLFACLLILLTSFLYLMQSLGKKASLTEMKAQANTMNSAPSAVLVQNEQLSSGTTAPNPFTPSYQNPSSGVAY